MSSQSTWQRRARLQGRTPAEQDAGPKSWNVWQRRGAAVKTERTCHLPPGSIWRQGSTTVAWRATGTGSHGRNHLLRHRIQPAARRSRRVARASAMPWWPVEGRPISPAAPCTIASCSILRAQQGPQPHTETNREGDARGQSSVSAWHAEDTRRSPCPQGPPTLVPSPIPVGCRV